MSRRRVAVETPEFAAFARRIIRSYAKRVADADEVDLAEMVRVRDEMDEAIGQAVAGMRRNHGRSWAYIGEAMGTSRQAAFKRFAKFCGED